MPTAPQGEVEFSGRPWNKAVFHGAIRPHVQRHWLRFVEVVEQSQTTRIELDFSQCSQAYPNAMLPIVTDVQRLLAGGAASQLVMPSDPAVARLFQNSNWAHFLDPRHYPERVSGMDRHLPVRRFTTPADQAGLVDRFIDVIMRILVLDRTSLGGIEWAMSEITDNVLNHADSPVGGFAQLTSFPKEQRIAFCVADGGKGILRSLREGHPELRSDVQAVRESVRAGVTRSKDVGQGNGLSGTRAISLSAQGQFRIVSGSADVLWKPDGVEELPMPAPFQGTAIDVQFSTAQPIELNRIIAESTQTPNYEHADTIELKYTSDDSRHLVFRMKDEAVGHGTRIAGRQMRTKCINLLRAEPNHALILDWSGVPMISSSFADEFVGKLFFEIGPTRFMSRVRQANMNATVGQLIDRAILQRTQQELENGKNGARS